MNSPGSISSHRPNIVVDRFGLRVFPTSLFDLGSLFVYVFLVGLCCFCFLARLFVCSVHVFGQTVFCFAWPTMPGQEPKEKGILYVVSEQARSITTVRIRAKRNDGNVKGKQH